MRSLVVFLLSFLITYLTIPVLRKLAFTLNILDLPGGRKIHKEATPLLGGIAVYFGLLLGVLTNWADLNFLFPIIIGGTILVVVGIINDIQELGVLVRLFAQIVASIIVISSGFRITFLPNNTIFGILPDQLLTVVWIVGVTNAYNCLDGLDGLAAGSAVLNALCFGIILYITGQYTLGLFAIIMIAACLAFLPYNFRNEKIFLGEAGSTFLGFTLACFAIVGEWAKADVVKLSIPILILGVPIFDMFFTTVMRIRDGKVKSVMEWMKYAGRDHFHHYLVDLGLRPHGAVVFIYFITFSLGLSAIMVCNDKPIEAYLSVIQASIIFSIIAVLIVIGRRRNSGWAS